MAKGKKREELERTTEKSRSHCDEMLDEALEETFPASDSPAITAPPAKDC